MKVFLSYRREDSPSVVDQVAASLRKQFGVDNVFKDVDSISPGENFLEKIQYALTVADVLLVVIGPQWLNSSSKPGKRRIDDPDDWVRIEVRKALQREDVRVVPLLVQGARMPNEGELPPGLKALAYRNARNLRPGSMFEVDLEHLARGLGRSNDSWTPIDKDADDESRTISKNQDTFVTNFMRLSASGLVMPIILIVLMALAASLAWRYYIGEKIGGPLESPDITIESQGFVE